MASSLSKQLHLIYIYKGFPNWKAFIVFAMFRYFDILFAHVRMNLLDRSKEGVQRHVGNVALEERATTQLDESELCGVEWECTNEVVVTM